MKGLSLLSAASLMLAGGCADENPWATAKQDQGSIHLTLGADTDLATSKPQFRSTGNSGSDNLRNYIEVPEASDFSIRLEKADGSYSKTWTNLQSFLDYTGEHTFDVGAYSLTAYYGEEGRQDFDSPYMEASASFNVLSGKTQEVDLTAELKNSMVKVNYTDAFKNYMSSYHARLHTEGRSDDILYHDGEQRCAFIEPNSATLAVHFTTKESGVNSSKIIGNFAPMAKTLHNVTFDIVPNRNGDATLSVSFDDSLEEDNIEIDLTEELLTTAAPTIKFSEGYFDGQTIDMLANTAMSTPLRLDVYAPGEIKSASLIVESTNFTPSWGGEINLTGISAEQKQQLNSCGIAFEGFGSADKPAGKFAAIDFTNFNKYLGKGSHKVSLLVTDKNDCVSETASFTINSEEITVDIVGQPRMGYCGEEATVSVDYNGQNPGDLEFRTYSVTGAAVVMSVKSWSEDTSTRGFEKRRYTFTLGLPDTAIAACDYMNFDIYQSGTTKKASGKIEIDVPDYTLDYDAFSHYVLIRVNMAQHPELREAAMRHIRIALDGETVSSNILRDYSTGIITIGGLTKSTIYGVKSSITSDQTVNTNGSFKTEDALEVPNGNFNGHGEKLEMSDLQVGGQYKVSPANYTIKSSFSYTLPADWATVNDLTAWEGSTNKNTWFIVPSSWLDTNENMGYMRNVGYSHNGTTPATSGGAFNTKYYCENTPSESELSKAAGELFLGTYSFNGTESRSEGIGFASRPNSISFDYDYTPTGSDEGYAHIKLTGTDGETLAEKTYALPSGQGSIHLPIDYQHFGSKASMLAVSFKSSNQATPPITIPTGKALSEGISLGSKTIGANTYHALATGSILKIDNVTANYDNVAGSSKPARKTTSKRK